MSRGSPPHDAPSIDRVRTIEPDHRDLAELVAAKRDRTVAVCIPCRDEAETIGALVRTIRTQLVDAAGLVDELIVLDDRSTDATADVAAGAGASLIPIEKVHAEHGEGRGKGNALWASLLASSADIVAWIDGDLTTFEPVWITRLVAPLLDDPDIALVKAFADRPERRDGGGRTTELVARPLLSLYFPALAHLRQPLAGEYAGRRTVLEALPFVEGWGVEIAMLIDIATRYGVGSIAQVDVGVREHTHRTLESLSVQAAEVMATVLARVPAGSLLDGDRSTLRRIDGTEVDLALTERPPIATLR